MACRRSTSTSGAGAWRSTSVRSRSSTGRTSRACARTSSVRTDRGPARALILDFNGTVSHDEHIVLELFQELFAEQGQPLDAATYERDLAGMSDPEIVWAWLGRDHPAVDDVIDEHD